MNRQVLNVVLMALMLAAIWLLLSGLFKPVLLFLATAAVILTVILAIRMDLIDSESHPVMAALRYVRYWPWLTVEIIKSSIDVARRILSPSINISPTVFELKADQQTNVGKVVYANSITLTPGTVTMDVDGDRILAHALSADTVEYALSGEMGRRVCAAEGSLQRARQRGGKGEGKGEGKEIEEKVRPGVGGDQG